MIVFGKSMFLIAIQSPSLPSSYYLLFVLWFRLSFGTLQSHFVFSIWSVKSEGLVGEFLICLDHIESVSLLKFAKQ